MLQRWRLLAVVVLLYLAGAKGQPTGGSPCDLSTCTCGDADLSHLKGKVVHAPRDAEGYAYALAICGEIAKEDLPSGCQQYAEHPSVVKYKGDNPADCIEIGSIGPCSQGTCGMTGMSELNGDVVVVYTYTYGCKNTMTLTLTKGQDPAPGQVTSNECSYTASWAVLGTATCRSYVGTAACEKLGPLANLTGPALIVVLVALCLSLVFPCCVLGIAWGTCIASKRVQGRSPTGVAWGFCCLFFFLSLVGGFFLPFVYYICSTVMIFPFCLGSDIFYTAPTTPTVVHTPGSPAVGVSHLKAQSNIQAPLLGQPNPAPQFLSPQQAAVRYTRSGRRIG